MFLYQLFQYERHSG